MKLRADVLLMERGLVDSRSLAQRSILAGQVRIGTDHVISKPSELVEQDADIRVHQPYPYVSRGAEKLLAAITAAQPIVTNTTCLDIGASTGGFTDLLLQHGAKRVYAVDVGYGQLHQKLRDDPRVVCLERVNARNLSPQQIPEPIDILTADVAFISLRKILPACAPLLKPGGWAFCLVKPQFEAQRHEVKRGGVVRDPDVRQRCVDEIVRFACSELEWDHVSTVPSPILGPKGNQEFVATFRRTTPELP